jgi:hypothetical protein
LILAPEDEIEDFKDAKGVDDKEYDEPDLLIVASGVPEREAFYDNRPREDDEKNGEEKEEGEPVEEGQSAKFVVARIHVNDYTIL